MKNKIDRKKACPMKSFLEELYLGRLYPLEQIVPQDPEFHSANEKKSGLMEILETDCRLKIFKRWKSFWMWIAI